MNDPIGPSGSLAVPERFDIPDVKVNQFFPDRRPSGNGRSGRCGNGHLDRISALLNAALTFVESVRTVLSDTSFCQAMVLAFAAIFC